MLMNSSTVLTLGLVSRWALDCTMYGCMCSNSIDKLCKYMLCVYTLGGVGKDRSRNDKYEEVSVLMDR